MSIVTGSPDWQRGSVSLGSLLASVPGATLTKTVQIPANAQSLWLAFSTAVLPDTIAVVGDTTGCPYPGTFHQGDPRTLNGFFFVFSVSSQLDSSVTVTLTTSSPLGEWYLYSQTSINAVDVPQFGLITQTVGQPTNLQGVLILGSDGIDGRVLKTDTTGQLYIANPGGGATPQPVGGALVSEGILAMGSDGTDGRAISTDSNGRQIPLVPTLQSIKYGAAGNFTLIAAPPAGSAWYLFAIDWLTTAGNATNVNLNDGVGNTISLFGTCGFASSGTVPLHGYRVTTSVIVAMQNNAVSVVLRYASGP